MHDYGKVEPGPSPILSRDEEQVLVDWWAVEMSMAENYEIVKKLLDKNGDLILSPITIFKGIGGMHYCAATLKKIKPGTKRRKKKRRRCKVQGRLWREEKITWSRGEEKSQHCHDCDCSKQESSEWYCVSSTSCSTAFSSQALLLLRRNVGALAEEDFNPESASSPCTSHPNSQVISVIQSVPFVSHKPKQRMGCMWFLWHVVPQRIHEHFTSWLQ